MTDCLNDDPGVYFEPNEDAVNKDRPIITSDISTKRNFKGDISYVFTRHANSCNNITGALGKVAEPSVVHSEILRVVEFSGKNKLLPVTFHDPVRELDVHVSCLVRTWETAIGLYGPHANTINLILSPYLREKSYQVSRVQLKRLGSQFDKGNYAAPFSHQLQSFQRFLLKVMLIGRYNTDLARIVCTRINLIVFDPDQEFSGGGGYEIATFIYSPDAQIQWYSHVASYEFKFPPHFDAFYFDGIERFMASMKASRYYSKEYIFVVSHNGVLTRFAKKQQQFARFGGTHQNVWSFSNVTNKKGVAKKWKCYRGLMPSSNVRSLAHDELCKYDKPLPTSLTAPYRAKDELESVWDYEDDAELSPVGSDSLNDFPLLQSFSPPFSPPLSPTHGRKLFTNGSSPIGSPIGSSGGHRRRSKALKRGVKMRVTRKLF